MAVYQTTRPVTAGFGTRMTSVLPTLLGAIATWNDSRATKSQLSKLSDHELYDIGLNRGDIESMSN